MIFISPKQAKEPNVQEHTTTSLDVGRLLDAAGYLARRAGAVGCSKRSREERRERSPRGLSVPPRLASCAHGDWERCWRA